VKAMTPAQEQEGEKHLSKVLPILPQVNADKAMHLGKGMKDDEIAKKSGLDLGQVKNARKVGQSQGKIAVKGVWGGAFKV
jgi:hypothetical protein